MTDNFGGDRHGTSIAKFGDQIRAARTARGWSQGYLAEVTGYDPATISTVERSVVYPNVATLQDLAIALEIDFLIVGKG